MTYVRPKQKRAQETQERFLDAMEQLLQKQSFSATTIDKIASQAGLGRGAFLSRFGSKRGAMEVLWARYADACIQHANDITLPKIKQHSYLWQALSCVVKDVEDMQAAHIGSNRAMAELFQEELKPHPLTVEVFFKLVEIMQACKARFVESAKCSEAGINHAAQLLITLSFQYNMKAMPALPRNDIERHELIGKMLAIALER